MLSLQTLTYIFGDMLNSVGAAGKVFEYLDREPQVSTNGKLAPDQLTGHVSFRHLNFAYPKCPNKTVLQVSGDCQEGKGFSSIYEENIVEHRLCPSCVSLFSRTSPWR